MDDQRSTSTAHAETGCRLSPLLKWDSIYLAVIQTSHLEVGINKFKPWTILEVSVLEKCS
jgi:hypothetical protein